MTNLQSLILDRNHFNRIQDWEQVAIIDGDLFSLRCDLEEEEEPTEEILEQLEIINDIID